MPPPITWHLLRTPRPLPSAFPLGKIDSLLALPTSSYSSRKRRHPPPFLAAAEPLRNSVLLIAANARRKGMKANGRKKRPETAANLLYESSLSGRIRSHFLRGILKHQQRSDGREISSSPIPPLPQCQSISFGHFRKFVQAILSLRTLLVAFRFAGCAYNCWGSSHCVSF